MLKEAIQELGLLRKDGASVKAHETVRKRQINSLTYILKYRS